MPIADHLLCLGCMSFGTGKWRSWVLDEAEALDLLDVAAHHGLRMFDTANVYSGGESERILGRFLRSRGLRNQAFVATKLFYDTPDRLNLTGLGRSNIIGSTEASLKRLGIDRIDLLQIHRWDAATPIEETLAAFATLIEAGKVGAIGASNLSAWHLAKALMVAQRDGLPRFTAVQPHYNLLYREDERDLIPLCQDQHIHLLPWSPLARGRLARTAPSVRSTQDDVSDTLYGDGDDDDVMTVLRAIAAETGEAPASLALAWLVQKGMTPIFGATRRSHVAQAVRATEITLDPAQIDRLETAYRPRAMVELPYTAKNQATTQHLAAIIQQ